MSISASAAAAKFPSTELLRWVGAVYEPQPAELAAWGLVRTSLRGIDTHGISRVPAYAERLRAGDFNPRPRPRMEVRDQVLHYDADGGLGHVVGVYAVREAIALARNTAVVTCLIRNSGHLGALGQIIIEAAEQGMVAFFCQKTGPSVALEGSLRPAIGNNPLAFVMPVAGRPPLVFDMATSVVANGHLMQAKRDGLATIPAGWAIGPDGRPTQDLMQAMQGALLPVAGPKGIGLSMLVECLAGSLADASAPAKAASRSGSSGGLSAFLLVMNPDSIIGREAFDRHVAGWLTTYLEATGPDARYPGQRQAECEAERLAHGVPIASSTLAELRATGDSVGCRFDVAPMQEPG